VHCLLGIPIDLGRLQLAIALKPRKRETLVLSWASRTVAGTLSALKVCSRTTPSTVMPWRAWKRRTAAST